MKHKFYKTFNLTKKKDKDWLKKQELANLFHRPPKLEYEDSAHFNQTYSPNVDHQADLLFLPNDNGYKYALVVTDVATRLSDAEPLRSKDSSEVRDAFKTIYQRGILSLPEFIYTDPGKEFRGEVKKYFEKHKVSHKYGKPGRHRQLGMVERTNQYLAKAIFYRQQAQEMLTDQTSKEWVDDLPRFIKALNKIRKRKPPKIAKTHTIGKDKEVLDIGTRVRAILDNPINYIDEKRLHGKFRVTDIRWNPEIMTIGNIMILPGRPPLYLLKDSKGKLDMSVAYPKKHLQVVPDDEEDPPSSVIRGNPKTYVAKKIIGRKKKDGKIYYLVRWKGFTSKDDTWERRKNLFGSDIPKLIEDFESRLKNRKRKKLILS